MQARVMIRLTDRTRKVDMSRLANMPVTASVLVPFAVKVAAMLADQTGAAEEVPADVLAAVATQIGIELIEGTESLIWRSALLANGWLLLARLDQRDAGHQDEPYLPMALAA